MRIYLIVASLFFILTACKKQSVKTDKVSVVDSAMLKEGWVQLFDGKSFDGWHSYLKDSITNQWKVEDGMMIYAPDPEKNQGVNNLITDKKYKNFELSLEWKIPADGNSGVFYGILEDEKFVVPYMTAPEVQIRDYSSNPEFTDLKQMSGAVFGIIGPEKDMSNKPGEWNHFLIKIDHTKNRGSVTLNGVEVTKFPVNNEAWDDLVSKSKFNDWEGFGSSNNGHIGLQDHGHGVRFRNIMIKELD